MRSGSICGSGASVCGLDAQAEGENVHVNKLFLYGTLKIERNKIMSCGDAETCSHEGRLCTIREIIS